MRFREFGIMVISFLVTLFLLVSVAPSVYAEDFVFSHTLADAPRVALRIVRNTERAVGEFFLETPFPPFLEELSLPHSETLSLRGFASMTTRGETLVASLYSRFKTLFFGPDPKEPVELIPTDAPLTLEEADALRRDIDTLTQDIALLRRTASAPSAPASPSSLSLSCKNA